MGGWFWVVRYWFTAFSIVGIGPDDVSWGGFLGGLGSERTTCAGTEIYNCVFFFVDVGNVV